MWQPDEETSFNEAQADVLEAIAQAEGSDLLTNRQNHDFKRRVDRVAMNFCRPSSLSIH